MRFHLALLAAVCIAAGTAWSESIPIVPPPTSLVGGTGSVVDIANPNDLNSDGTFDDPLICRSTLANCWYKSGPVGKTGWWAARTSNGTTATTWGAMQEKVIFTGILKQTVVGATYTTCFRLYVQTEINLLVTCGEYRSKIQFSRDVFVTSWNLIGRSVNSTGTAQALADGVTMKLVTGGGGATEISGSEFDAPAEQDATIASGESTGTTVGYLLPAGGTIMIKAKDGPNCQDGENCVFDGWGYSTLEIWGVMQ